MASGLILLEGFDSIGSTTDRYATTFNRSTDPARSRWSTGKGMYCAYSSHVRFSLGGTRSHVIVGVALKDTDGEYQISFYDSDTSTHQGQLHIQAGSGALRYVRGANITQLGTTSTLLWNDSIWNYVELRVKFDGSAGEVELKLNGVQVLNLTSQDTTQSANNYCTEVWVGNCINIDDVYIVDKTVGGADFLGDVRVVGLLPNADSTVAWTPSTGTANYGCIDETDTNQDTDYVYTSTTGAVDLYGLPDLSGSPTIKGVEVVTTAKRDNTQAAEIRNLLKSGTATSTGITTSLSTDYVIVRDMFEDVPGGTGWTSSDVNGLLSGVERIS